MSTRCNIIVRGKGKRTTLYRHMDGYPEGTGEDLRQKLAQTWHNQTAAFATDLVRQIRDSEYSPHVYCLSSELSDDIEYLYVVRLVSRVIDCYKVNPFDDSVEWTEEALATRARRVKRWNVPLPGHLENYRALQSMSAESNR